MDNPKGDPSRGPVRFGPYEVDFGAGELRKHGLRVKIQEKPLRLLEALLDNPGKLVTRDELRQKVWSSDVYVDFDRNVKIALNKLRSALCDSAESPRYIETVPKRGYRFIARVEHVNGDGASPIQAATGVSPNYVPLANGNGESSRAAKAVVPPGAIEEPRYKTNAALKPRRRWAVALVIALSASAAAFYFTRPPARPTFGFHQRDWVLVSRFENRTGEPVLDGTMDFAVARELSNSHFVGVVPPERVGDDLRLMKKSPTTPINPDLAWQICQRDDGIRALITGRVEKVGSTYELSAGIVDPSTDVQVAGVESQTKDLDGLLPAVRDLSNKLRAALGEDLPSIRESNLKLEKVTTPSLHALQLYSQAMTLTLEGQWNSEEPWKQAIPLLEQALAEDPDFASAHVLLAYCYWNLGQRDLAKPHFRRAFELASTVSERERLFIVGSYYRSVNPDVSREMQAYEALVRLYPDDYWGTYNLDGLLRSAGRWNEATKLMEHRADLRPSDFYANFNAWEELEIEGRVYEARRYFARAKNQLTPEIEEAYPGECMEMESSAAREDVIHWNTRKGFAETQQLAGTAATLSARARVELAAEIASIYTDLGRFKSAQEWIEKIPPGSPARFLPAEYLAEARGDRAALRKALQRQLALKRYGPVTAVRLAQAGMLKESRNVIAWLIRNHAYASGWVSLDQGAYDLATRQAKDAVPLLRTALEKLEPLKGNMALGNTGDLLATALDRQGQTSEAIQVLRPLEQEHRLNLRSSFHLFQLYEKVHDTQNAQEVRKDLLQRLAYADADDPILVQLHKQETLRSSL